jgi:MFS family permease
MFGSITYLPLFLQIAKGMSPTHSGLMLTPMMGGLLVTSIGAGRSISRWGRWRPFPIAGTAVTAVGMTLLSRLGLGTATTTAALYMLVLGLGLGMVMQVLVLAVQNAVDPRHMGTATSGTILFRQVGGSVGIAIFGAIFANRLHTELASRGIHTAARTASPAAIRQLPVAARHIYARAIAASLHPVFLTAAAISICAFLLTWLYRETPLRASVRPLDGEEFTPSAAAEASPVD